MIGDHSFLSDEVETFVDQIVDIAQKKLKRVLKRSKQKCWTTVFVCERTANHKSQRGMLWEVWHSTLDILKIVIFARVLFRTNMIMRLSFKVYCVYLVV